MAVKTIQVSWVNKRTGKHGTTTATIEPDKKEPNTSDK